MIDVILLSGGKGSRSEDPSIPKSLQLLSPEVRVIDTICRAISTLPVNRVIAVLGEHELVQRAEFAELIWGAPLDFTASLGLGTSAAVLEGSFRASAEYCLIVMADCAMSVPLNGYLEELISGDFDGLVLGRYSDHPSDSDTILMGADGFVEDFIPKGGNRSSTGSDLLTSLSGVLFVRTQILRNLSGAGDFQSEFFQMVRDRRLRVKAKVTRYFLRDTGTPKRVQAVRDAVVSGAFQRRGSANAAGVFIDRDGTLIPNTGDDRKAIKVGDISPNVISELANLNALGIPWFIVTNQPGVAKGKVSLEEVSGTFLQLQNLLSKSGVFFDDFRYCPHHPEKGWEGEVSELKFVCRCRKPSSGMVEDLQSEHSLNLEASWLIGDSLADERLASGIGCQYIGITTDDSDALANSIRRAASEITNAS